MDIESKGTKIRQFNQPVTLRRGEKIEDLYDVKEELGKGRFGKVYRCVERSTGKPWAAKFIKAIKQKDKEAVYSEIAIMNELDHPNLLRCVDACQVGSQMVMIMEIILGGELFERVISEDFDLSEGDVIMFMRQICEGVRHMHDKHILHLDLKPENILCVDKTGHLIKLIDFGLSKKFHPTENARVLFGTPEFVAPEVVNYEEISFATDMWSVGVICYVLLSGLSPFLGSSEAETFNNVTKAEWDFEDDVFDNISENAKDFIEHLLVKRKEKRMTVKDCLQHNWLRNSMEEMAEHKLSKERLRKFVARRRWQKTANAVRAIGRMTALRLFSEQKKLEALVPKENSTDTGSHHSTKCGDNLETSSFSPSSNVLLPFKETESTKVLKATKATSIRSAFRQNKPESTKKRTFTELKDTEPRVISRLSSKSSYITDKQFKREARDIMNRDPSDPVVADAATEIQASYRSHRNRRVNLEPPKIVTPLQNCEVGEGTTARFECRFAGYPEPDICWYKDGKQIEESNRYRMEYEKDALCSMTILEVEPDDDGRYRCEAKNSAGKTSCRAKLIVEVLIAKAESADDEEQLKTTGLTSLPTINQHTSRAFQRVQAVSNSTSVKSSFPAATATKATIPASTAVKSSLKVRLSSVNTSKCSQATSTSTSISRVGGIQVRNVRGKNTEHSRQRPAVNYNVSESSETTSRQVQGAIPAENKTTGTVLLKTHQSNGITQRTESAPTKVTQPGNVYVKESDATPRKTNTAGEPKPTSIIGVSKTANVKIQEAVNRLKGKTLLDESDKRTKSSMIRGQGIGALTAKFESPTESKPEKTTRKDPIITSKVSARKEIFNTNNEKDASSGITQKHLPTRSVVERYTLPGKSASLKSKFEAKPEADKQPQFLRKPHGQTVTEGDSVKLTCKPSGIPFPSLNWQFNGKTLKDTEKYEIYIEKDVHYLEIFDLSRDDAGTYTCKLLNSTGRASASAELTVNEKVRTKRRQETVQEKRPLFVKTLEDSDVTEGEEATLKCTVSGIPSPEVTWLFEGKPIIECKRRRITRNDGVCELIISNVTENDDAVYTCTAKNKLGSVSCTAEIIVEPLRSPRVDTKVNETTKSVETLKKFETLKKEEETFKKFEIPFRRETQIKTESSVRTSPFRVTDKKQDREKLFNNNDIKTGNMQNRNETGPLSRLKLSTSTSPQPKPQSHLRPVPKAPKAPAFLVRLRSQTVTEPRAARFSCLVKGTPDPTVTWSKDDGDPIHDDGRIKLSEDKGEHKLEINETSTLDSGRYTCTVMNEAGKTSASANLTVNAQYTRDVAPKFLQNLEDIKVKDGEPAKFSCKITASPKPSVQWIFKGKDIPSDDDVYETSFDGSLATLSLSDVLPEDEGEYTCSVRNSKGSCACSARLNVQVDAKSPPPSTLSPSLKSDTSVSSEPETIPDTDSLIQDSHEVHNPEPDIQSKVTDVQETVIVNTMTDSEYCQCTTTVFTFPDGTDARAQKTEKKQIMKADSVGKPEFITKLEDIEVVDGSPVVLSVKVKGEPLPYVMWIFDECEILEDDDFKVVQDGDTFSLMIREVYPEDAGEYTCRLIGDNEVEVECAAQLIVKDPDGQPAKFLQKPRSISVDEGSNVKLSCKFEGDPEPCLTWYKDDQEIKHDERFIIGMSSIKDLHTLEIPAVLVTDAGNYTCTVKNDLGEENCTVAVRVKQLLEEQTDFRSLLKSRPRLQNIQSPPGYDRQTKKPIQEQEAEQLDFRHVLTRHVQTKKRPRFLKELESVCVKEGDAAVFECNVDGVPEPTVAWTVRGKPIKESKYFQMSYDGQISRLAITEAFPEDAGEYKCVASNMAGQCATISDLKVEPYEGDVEVRYNTNNSNSAKDNCTRGDLHIDPNNTTSVDEPECPRNTDIQTSVTKVLPPVAPKCFNIASRGLTGVVASSSQEQKTQAVKTMISRSEIVTVNGGRVAATMPVFAEELRDKPITEGSVARLQCRVLSEQEPDILWYKDGKEMHEGRKYTFEFEDDDVVLLINNATMNDLGTYTCIATNNAGAQQSSAQLIMGSSVPPEVEGGPTNLQVLAGQTLNISCKISGQPTPDVNWYKDRKQLANNERIHIDSSRTSTSLVITNAKDQDAGIYSLCLENACGRDKFAISVSIVDKPEAPTGKPIASDVGRDTLTLSWSGSPYDGGSRITGYIIEMCHTQDRKWNRFTRTSSTSHVLHDLDPEVGYLFRVCAENTHGVSQPSDISDPILTVDDEDDIFGVCKQEDSDGTQQKDIADNVTSPSDARVKIHHFDDVKRTEDLNICENDEMSRTYSEIADQHGLTPSQTDHTSFDDAEESVVPYYVTIKKDKEMLDFYELKEQLGKGRFGVVYRCVDKNTKKEFAAKCIKIIPKEMDVIREEIAIMNALHHPKLLQCVDAFENPRQMTMILELIAGGELFERVIDDDFVLTERDVIKFTRQICAGVQHMHQQSILHLDLKPENIMCVDKIGNRIKLIDFGLARKFNPEDNVKIMFGTPEFVAPEVINYEKINFATDMWSVGVICYILLSGLSPFMGDNDAETLSNVTSAEWDFEDVAFDDITDDAKQFIKNLLIKNLEIRKSVDECMQDKWLINDTNKMKVCKISKDNFRKFVARRRWQKTATAVRALGRMASLTTLSSSKKINGNDTSPPGNNLDKTPFSALLRQKRVEEAKNASSPNDTGFPRSHKPPPLATRLKPVHTTANSKISLTDRNQDQLGNTETVNGDVQHGHSKVIAPKFVKKMVDCEVFVGDCARFDCQIIGEPEPEITWLQDGIKVEESQRFIFDYDDDGMCSLIIKNVIEDDDAEYTFTASNLVGEITCTAEMIVDEL